MYKQYVLTPYMDEQWFDKFQHDLGEALNELDVASKQDEVDIESGDDLPVVLEESSSQLVNIIPKLNTMKTNITSIKESLIKEIVHDKSLHLLLYADGAHLSSQSGESFIPWWSTILYRIDMAQTIITKSQRNDTKYEDIGKELYADDPSLKHVLAALGNPENIIEELSKDAEVYKRALSWFSMNSEEDYINLCMQCFCAFFKAERIQGKVRELHLVRNTDGSYGLIDDETTYNIKTKKRVLARRESMVWFAKEVANAYLFRLDWDNAIKWSRLVYNMLTNV